MKINIVSNIGTITRYEVNKAFIDITLDDIRGILHRVYGTTEVILTGWAPVPESKVIKLEGRELEQAREILRERKHAFHIDKWVRICEILDMEP